MYLSVYESSKQNKSKPRENANQSPSFVVSAKSMFQLASVGDIIGRVQVIDILDCIDIVVL